MYPDVDARGGRKLRHTHTHTTHTRDNYSSPHCAHARSVKFQTNMNIHCRHIGVYRMYAPTRGFNDQLYTHAVLYCAASSSQFRLLSAYRRTECTHPPEGLMTNYTRTQFCIAQLHRASFVCALCVDVIDKEIIDIIIQREHGNY